jgi:hypothetical protein
MQPATVVRLACRCCSLLMSLAEVCRRLPVFSPCSAASDPRMLVALLQSGLHGTVTSALDGSALLAQIEVEGAGRPVRAPHYAWKMAP